MRKIDAVALPDNLVHEQLQDRVAVVIDILRATTTIVNAMEQGAKNIVPVASVDSARILAQDNPDSILCGERGGIKPEGFILGNSPFEYSRKVVDGKSCILTTTNGTRALRMSEDAAQVVVGSLRNLDALCDWIKTDGRNVVLVCSGTDRRVSLEDCIGAGLIIDRLGYAATDSAALMYHAMHSAVNRFDGVRFAIESSSHAKRLINLGFAQDVQFACEIGVSLTVPLFDSGVGEIHLD
ncbi:MAG: 2-phosphosulfolactate phosphatase [Phycisphaerales bacterium]|nr:2-phosphosulfolactate phosphatase [Phycisphaerales bacterium]